MTPYEDIFDEETGLKLDPAMVLAARRDEVDFLRKFPVYQRVPRSQAQGKEFV